MMMIIIIIIIYRFLGYRGRSFLAVVFSPLPSSHCRLSSVFFLNSATKKVNFSRVSPLEPEVSPPSPSDATVCGCCFAVFRYILGSACNLVDAIQGSMMKAFDSAMQVTEKLDSQFVANVQYKVSLSASVMKHICLTEAVARSAFSAAR